MSRNSNSGPHNDFRSFLQRPLLGWPLYADWPRVPHYYGDTVQQLFVIAAALILFTAPFYSEMIATQLPLAIGGALILAALAALTSPHSRLIMTFDAIAAGVGLVIFEMWALTDFATSTGIQFVLREAIALVLLFAFFFSIRTIRTMIYNEIGHRDSPRDFMDELEDNPNRIHDVIDDVDG